MAKASRKIQLINEKESILTLNQFKNKKQKMCLADGLGFAGAAYGAGLGHFDDFHLGHGALGLGSHLGGLDLGLHTADFGLHHAGADLGLGLGLGLHTADFGLHHHAGLDFSAAHIAAPIAAAPIDLGFHHHHLHHGCF